MKNQEFQLVCVNSSLPAVLLDSGEWLFHAPDVCMFADLVMRREDGSRWVRTNLPPKWFLEFRPTRQVGRPGLYLKLSGFLYALSQGTSEVSLKFRDEVYENILPNIIKHGGYISPDATKEQLTNLQSDINSRLSAFESAYNLCKDQHDERGMLFIKDQVQNLADKLNHTDTDIPKDWLSISELLEQRGYTITKLIRNSLSQIGKNIKKTYESETGLAVKVTTKAVGSGHKSDDIKVYPPDWHDRIEQK
jgi:prophage antirepressor-like protein